LATKVFLKHVPALEARVKLPKIGIVAYLVDFKTGWSESLEAKREAALQLIKVQENEWLMAEGLIEYAHLVDALAREAINHGERLARHTSVRAIERLKGNSQTLEGNQNGALLVLYEFKHQIDELLALADGYEYCRHAVSQLAAAKNNHETELQALSLAFSNGIRMQEQLNAASSRLLAQQRDAQGGPGETDRASYKAVGQ
jgi:hypothetical protein